MVKTKTYLGRKRKHSHTVYTEGSKTKAIKTKGKLNRKLKIQWFRLAIKQYHNQFNLISSVFRFVFPELHR